MTVEVRAVPDPEDDQGEAVTQAPPTSALAELRRKVEERRAERYVDLPVQDLDVIVVRYGPVPSAELDRIQQYRIPRKGQKRDPEAGLLSSCDVLARACLGIFERDEATGELVTDGRYLHTEDGEPLTFATIRVAPDSKRSADQVRALYVTDGDVISTAEKVLALSGYEAQDQEPILGE